MDILQQSKTLTLEEKASLCSGSNATNTRAIERLGVPAITMCDGPHGLRKPREQSELHAPNASLPATCFPAACATASSWDRDLLRRIGAALGEECAQEGVSLVLGPGVNIKRNPLCGRNFEYFSEDPLLAGELASAYIEGVQSQGIGTSLKHFAVNNQETQRMTVNALVDERALREIYLPAFEKAVTQARPWTVMAAYNRVNGPFCSEHELLLHTILREEWGFEGVVVSDWGAVNDRVAGLKAGLDLEMPGGGLDNNQRIVDAVRIGSLPEAVLNRAVQRLLALVERGRANLRPGYRYDQEAHHQLARQAATRSAVLLKNEGDTLPLVPSAKLAVIGSLAETMRFQGAGSSMVNPTRVEQPLAVLRERCGEVRYAAGYQRLSEENDEQFLEEACMVARQAERVIVFLGLTELAESEGFDRSHMRLPENQLTLMQCLTDVRDDLIVILTGGAPVEMPWLSKVSALLHMYLPGQAGGAAVADLLFGAANPSGKLAETYPLHYEDTASARTFPGSRFTVEYRESIFVGYRFFDTAHQEVLFPFGHGLSYTSFTYHDLHLSASELSENETLQVSVTITNTGMRAGEEIVQVYIRDVESSKPQPDKVLCGFAKILLQPGESRLVSFSLEKRAFAYYDMPTSAWVVEAGQFEILVGASSRDIRLRQTIIIHGQQPARPLPDTLVEYTRLATNKGQISQQTFAALYGSEYAEMPTAAARPYTVNSTLNDIQSTFIGKVLRRAMTNAALKSVAQDDPTRRLVTTKMLEETLLNMPLRSLATSSEGALTMGMAEGFVLLANGQFLRGGLKILRSLPKKKQGRKKSIAVMG